MSEDKAREEVLQEAILALTAKINARPYEGIGLGLIAIALSIGYLADTIKEAANKGIRIENI